MKYLCLVYHDEEKLNAMPKDAMDALVDEHLDYDDVLRRSGHFIVADALESVRTATTVRVRNGKVSLTDGPFAETKETLGGFFLIRARDVDEAIRVASRCARSRRSFARTAAIADVIYRKESPLRSRSPKAEKPALRGPRQGQRPL